jgi:hypothetical protein
VLSCVVDHILQEFNTLFLTRFRTYNIATPPQTKTPVKTPSRDWCLNMVPSSMGTNLAPAEFGSGQSKLRTQQVEDDRAANINS